ncbi:MAG: hypothetical protein IAE79_13020 [Anaerolinea sp.]|nr:hypothetical protein [Anaerolinea sp.]
MAYYTIHYNEQKEPYLIEKNFGYRAQVDDSSSHWTWHITERGITHLSRDFFGKPTKMPTQISREQLEDLKAFNMLRRSDGALIGANPLYPSDVRAAPARPVRSSPKPTTQPGKRPVKPVTPPVALPPKPQRGFWGWLKSLFGGE